MKPRPGLLIALEGIDGAGKSTLQRTLARRLRRLGWPVRLAAEPSDPDLGRRAVEAGATDPRGAAILFTQDRLLRRPALDRLLSRPVIVLQDRSFYSTLAYQGSALPPTERRRLSELQRRVALPPDRVLWLSLPPADALRRLSRRGGRRSALERLRTLERVDGAYRSLSRRPAWIELDARRPADEVAEAALRLLDPWLRARRARGPHR